MATLALSVAGQFVGGAIGGPIGATLGRAVGALAGNALDNALFAPESAPAPAPADLAFTGSREGDALPRIYGWARIAGNIIWATELEQSTEVSSGGKGVEPTPEGEEPEYLANFAIGLCEGKIHHVGRIWADGRLLETQDLQIRVHKGGNGQNVDPLIEAKQGEGRAPAYRGLAYIVFDGLPLKQFGNRIPNISVEVCRAVGDLEKDVRAVTIIPASTEYGYDPSPLVRVVGSGQTALENTHQLAHTSNWSLSISQLLDLCPNLKHVALVVSWFGDDLRANHCQVQPRSESQTRTISDRSWTVSGVSRSGVPEVSTYQGGPAFGGTPSDDSVLAAIADLKARGVAVTLYPFMMMDIPEGNSKTDPYTGGASQPAYPWRGRLTCAPAPNTAGSPDKTAAATSQVDQFVGNAQPADFSLADDSVNFSGGADWGYRRFILHYAHLCQLAGGVDAFLIGSEMRGLSQVRSGDTDFPFVDALADLIGDVRSIVGSGTKLSYAADWSEYHGLQPADQPGDKIFHLDPLWAHQELDAIGIDNYMPLSDWHGDDDAAQSAVDPTYDLGELTSNIAGGEGFEWFYASQEDRENYVRTPISDLDHGEPWIWRYKDIKSWWQSNHHNRVNGSRDATPTAWQPQSKPIWFTELGCAAINKGPNQPNVFGDPKSSEDASPYFSTGEEDALAQRQFLRAHQAFWHSDGTHFESTNNPISSVYGDEMVDTDRIYLWTWDARPFPAFPNRSDIWSDATNHKIGHWLTGRLGGASASELLAQMANDYHVELVASASGDAFVHGLQVPRIATMRQAAQSCVDVAQVHWVGRSDGLHAISQNAGQTISVDLEDLVHQGQSVFIVKHDSSEGHVGQLNLSFSSFSGDYQNRLASAFAPNGPVVSATHTNLTLTDQQARKAAESVLQKNRNRNELDLALPPSMDAIEVADRLLVPQISAAPFLVESIKKSDVVRLTGREWVQTAGVRSEGDEQLAAHDEPLAPAKPEIVIAQVPAEGGDDYATKLVVGAFADPWPGRLSFATPELGQTWGQTYAAASIGHVTKAPSLGSPRFVDRKSELEVELLSGHLASTSFVSASNHSNLMLIQHDDGAWEYVSFVDASLEAENTYRLRNLLRGLNSTHRALASPVSVGNKVLVLGETIAETFIPLEMLEQELEIVASSNSATILQDPTQIYLSRDLALPEPPAHPRARLLPGSSDIEITWIRRSRKNAESWALSNVGIDFSPIEFELTIFKLGTPVLRVRTQSESFVLNSDDQLSLIGGLGQPFTFEIVQISTLLGAGQKSAGAFYG